MVAGGPAVVFPRTAVFDAGRLVTLGGVAVEELAAEFGTPLYVLDRAELVGRMRHYRQAFGAETTVVYASKALCVVGVLQLAAAEELAVDVASAGELHTALLAGVDPASLVVHGNNKSAEELAGAVGAGAGRIVVDGPGELVRVGAVGRERGRPVDVLLRITPGIDAATHAAVATGGDTSKFGFPLAAGMAREGVAAALAEPGVRLAGLHAHVGSNIRDPLTFAAAAERLCALRAEVAQAHRVEMEELNLGGGLAIAYEPGDEVPSLEAYAAALESAVDAASAHALLAPPKLWIEPGRSIAGPAGVTLYAVGDVKRVSDGPTFAAVDGGMSDNPRPALYGARYTVVAAGAGAPHVPGEPEAHGPVTVVGKHCESGDVVARDVDLPPLAPGDLLAVAATGAYGYAMASNYNRVPRPAMVLVHEGRADLLVRRETVEDVARLDVSLPSTMIP